MLIRTRLTLWFTVLLALVLGLFSWAVYTGTSRSVLDELRRDVQARGDAVAAALEAGPAAGGRPRLDAFATPSLYLQLTSYDGVTLERSSNLQGRELPYLEQDYRGGLVTEGRIGNWPLYLYGREVRLDGEEAWLVVGRSPGPLYQALQRLRGVLFPGAPLALGLSALVVWLLVRRATGPLIDLARAAEEISERADHDGRVGRVVQRRSDEIGQLARTVDEMLEALEAAHRSLQEANQAQRRFLADVSHELRTPLTIMLSSLELAQRIGANDPPFAERVLADMRAEADRMARMVTRLLTMARTGTGVTVALRPLLLGDILQDQCRQWVRDEGVALRCELLPALAEAVVEGDEDDLRQLFEILLDNAFKYTVAKYPSGGGEVTVTGAITGGTVEVSVQDTGVGIAPDDLPRVFERFYRAEDTSRYREQGHQGTGLGLSIARHLAEQHGGTVTASSELGRGSRFTVRLPLVQPAQPLLSAAR